MNDNVHKVEVSTNSWADQRAGRCANSPDDAVIDGMPIHRITNSPEERLFALQLLLHFVGDLDQPLLLISQPPAILRPDCETRATKI